VGNRGDPGRAQSAWIAQEPFTTEDTEASEGSVLFLHSLASDRESPVNDFIVEYLGVTRKRHRLRVLGVLRGEGSFQTLHRDSPHEIAKTPLLFPWEERWSSTGAKVLRAALPVSMLKGRHAHQVTRARGDRLEHG
jgi:hypothetical protein